MRSLRRVTLLAMAILATAAGVAGAAQKLNAYALQGQFMCVACHEPLNQVSSVEAQDEKDTLSQLVNQGLSFNQVKRQMVDIYSDAVLARPPARGINLLVYILPPVVLIAGLGFLAYNLPRWRRRAQAAAALAPLPEMPLDPADEQRLNAELETFDA